MGVLLAAVFLVGLVTYVYKRRSVTAALHLRTPPPPRSPAPTWPGPAQERPVEVPVERIVVRDREVPVER